MKSMTLSMDDVLLRSEIGSSSSQHPAARFVVCGAVGLQLGKMGADVLACRRHQCRIQSIIDVLGNALHAAMPGTKGIDHLLLAPAAMVEVCGEQSGRVRNRRP